MSNVKFKNYLEHKIHVKFVDGILEHSQEWKWFIDYIEENYDLADIESFSEFQNRSNPLIRILSYFINILEVCNTEFQFETLLLQETYLIAKYYVGAIERESCSVKISTEFCRILFLIVWLTKLQNAGNETKYTVDNRFLNQRNFHQAINMEIFEYDKEEIISYIEQISMHGLDLAKQNIIDNLNKVVYDVSENFFEKYGGFLQSVDCFNYQSLNRDISLTWQENTLLDMLQISIRDGKISPMFSNGDNLVPEYRSWTSRTLDQIKSYFNHDISDFVIESIDFLKNKKAPSLVTIEKHCNLLTELIKNGDDYAIYSSSTYEILALLYKEGVMDRVEKTDVIKSFYKTIHSITSINLLLKLRLFFPISNKQLSIVKNCIENQYKSITSIKDIHSLEQYLKNSDIARYINQQYYDKIREKFFELIEGIKDLSVANLFYQTMQFLLAVNQINQNIDKRIVKQDMINLQEKWQRNIYQEQIENLQEFTFNSKVPTAEVELFNESILRNPIILANSCVITKVENMISVMEEESKYALINMVSRITLSPIFPMKDTGINFYKHETDNLLKSQVEKIVKEYGYKFLNMLDVEIYVSAIHKRYKENVSFIISMFNKEEELYALLEELLEVSLIPYEKNISLGHLTQLLPLLEIEIRRLGKMFRIVPFKESKYEFMKFKDPSSILRELINNVYQEQDGFESAPDLLFVYHFMYNGNSLNIRNECIHGRDYLEGQQLRFGFKVTLLALYMVRYRLSLIINNLSQD